MSLIKGVHHIAIKTKPDDFDRVLDFYKNLLGLEYIRGWGSGDNRAEMISCGDNTVLEIMSNGTESELGVGAFRHIAFATDDVDSMVEKIRSKGFVIEVEPSDIVIECETPYPVRVAFCRGVLNEQIEFFCEKH